jgi:hypothetical protein
MKQHLVLTAALGLLFGWMGQANADLTTIYSDFGPGQTYLPDYYSVSGGAPGDALPTGYGAALAESFIPTSN